MPTKPGCDDPRAFRASLGPDPVVVAYGVGVDSTAMLIGLRDHGVVPELILFADTGSEKPETIAYLDVIGPWLAANRFPPAVRIKRDSPRAGDTSGRVQVGAVSYPAAPSPYQPVDSAEYLPFANLVGSQRAVVEPATATSMGWESVVALAKLSSVDGAWGTAQAAEVVAECSLSQAWRGIDYRPTVSRDEASASLQEGFGLLSEKVTWEKCPGCEGPVALGWVGHTVTELAEVIWRTIKGPDIPLRVVHDPAFEYDVQRRVPDVTKARQVLGFEATTSLEDMLGEVIPWIEQAIARGTI